MEQDLLTLCSDKTTYDDLAPKKKQKSAGTINDDCQFKLIAEHLKKTACFIKRMVRLTVYICCSEVI